MELHGKKDSHGWVWALFRIHGSLAALPSSTNSKMLTVPRHHVLKRLNTMIENPATRSHMGVKEVINMVRGLRAFISKDPHQLQQLEALTKLYQTMTRGKGIEFETDPKKRALVTMFLSPDLNRFDSHNIPKAFCDWLQDMKVVANDRHVDAFARRKSDHGIPGQSTDVLVVRYPEANISVDGMMAQMIHITREMEIKSGTARPAQTMMPGVV